MSSAKAQCQEIASRRVLFVSSGLNSGGAEAMLRKLLVHASESGFEPTVVSMLDEGRYGQELRAKGIDVVCLQMRRPWQWPAAIIRFLALVRRLRPAVVQGWMYHGNLLSLLARIRLVGNPGSKIVWGIRHNLQALSSEKPLTRFIIRLGAILSVYVDSIVYVSKRAAEMHERIGYAAKSTRIIPNGFDIAAFMPATREQRAEARVSLDVATDHVLCIHMARFHPVKDHETFLRAVATVSESNTNALFLLAGYGVDGKNAQLVALIAKLGLEARVRLLGEMLDVRPLLAAADFLCLSSRSEAFPNVIGEAMAAGLPIVSTRVGDVEEIIGEAGFVVPPGRPEMLAAAIQKLIDLPAENRARMGEFARARVLAHYQINDVARAYWQMYSELIQSNRVSVGAF